MNYNDLKTIKEHFQEPENCFYSVPFWGWNDRIEKEELRFQMDEMKKQKMGGFFIHSREGLKTEYLSDEWMDMVKASVDYAKKKGMEAWIYDEDKWPSGCAGGMVSAADPERFTAKGLTLQVMEQAPFALDEEVKTQEGWKRIFLTEEQKRELCPSGERLLGVFAGKEGVLVFRQEISGPSLWYNHLAPTDNLNRDAVKEYMRITHERYEKICKDEFGKTVRGFFTDEPNFCDFFSCFPEGRPWLPWGENFDREFEKRRGYTLLPRLTSLFYEEDGNKKIRHDYWRTLTELFSDNYMKPLYQWCEERNLETTGHILYENDMGYGVRVSGGAMPHYRYLHVPGIDILGEQAREYLTVKQCTSVASQYGRKMVVSETYGCTGWGLSFEGQKWLGDWQFVLGVTRRCQHLALYSITGCRKRDYPPVFQYQNTWWEDLHILEDYFARVAMCTTAGKAVRRILVIHPLTTMWMKSHAVPEENLNHVEMNMGWLDEHLFSLNREGERYNRLAESLMRLHYDFDFGDEIILGEQGKALEGQLKVAESEYSLVIVPPLENLLSGTVALLLDYLKKGGRILWIGSPEVCVDGERSEKWKEFGDYQGFIRMDSEEEALAALAGLTDRPVQIRNRRFGEAEDFLVMTRQVQDGYILFVVNHSREESQDVRLYADIEGGVTVSDPLTGATEEKNAWLENGKTVFAETFQPSESKIYFIDKKMEPAGKKEEFPYRHPHRADQIWKVLGPRAEVKTDRENVLVLDTCRLKIKDEEFGEVLPVWKAQRNLRERLGMDPNYCNGIPQPYTWMSLPWEGEEPPFAMEFSFEAEKAAEENCWLAVEQAENYKLFLDGEECPLTSEWFLDRKIKMFELPAVAEGTHRLLLTGIYRRETELEDMYLTGNFGLTSDRKLTSPVKELTFGDWCTQGLYHYGGNVEYDFSLDEHVPEGKKIILQSGKFWGTLVKATVNGKDAGFFLNRCGGQELDITSLLEPDKNKIQLMVVGSLRNVLGPFHQAYTGCSRISWEDFRTEDGRYTEDYVLEPMGLEERFYLIIK